MSYCLSVLLNVMRSVLIIHGFCICDLLTCWSSFITPTFILVVLSTSLIDIFRVANSLSIQCPHLQLRPCFTFYIINKWFFVVCLVLCCSHFSFRLLLIPLFKMASNQDVEGLSSALKCKRVMMGLMEKIHWKYSQNSGKYYTYNYSY